MEWRGNYMKYKKTITITLVAILLCTSISVVAGARSPAFSRDELQNDLFKSRIRISFGFAGGLPTVCGGRTLQGSGLSSKSRFTSRIQRE